VTGGGAKSPNHDPHRGLTFRWKGRNFKVTELIGNSAESWEGAAQNALDDADESLEHISGIEIESQTADVENGQVERYKTTVRVSFVLQDR
jgi:flavin-binding protein dodecin